MKTKWNALLLTSFLLLSGIGQSAFADVINFDDLPPINAGNRIANGYAGFNWSNMYAFDPVQTGIAGYINGVVSPSNDAYNGWGMPAVISKAGTFDFNGAWFKSAFNSNNVLTLTGKAGGNKLYTLTATLNTDEPIWVNANFTGIDELDLSTSSGHFAMDNFTYNASVPSPVPITADAGQNISITSEEQGITIITGTATDPNEGSLICRWLEGTAELIPSQPVGTKGECPLNLNTLPILSIGEHTLTLEVTDGNRTSTDEMILTVGNSAPHPAPTGGGTYEISAPVILGGQISDCDGDWVSYNWREGTSLIASGTIKTNYGGAAVSLPSYPRSNIGIGDHTISLCANDGYNTEVCRDISVKIIDTIAPTLSPVPSATILSPPNHKMVNITIWANASDSSGGPVLLSAAVTSNEPQDGLGDGDMSPDWTIPIVDQTTGVITLQLRAERSGSGNGRTYTVMITARDASGNFSSADVNIIVPRDQRQK
jgi:hypothetical protein